MEEDGARTVAATAEGDISVSLSALCLIRDDEWGDGASGGSHRGAATHVSGHVRFDTRHASAYVRQTLTRYRPSAFQSSVRAAARAEANGHERATPPRSNSSSRLQEQN